MKVACSRCRCWVVCVRNRLRVAKRQLGGCQQACIHAPHVFHMSREKQGARLWGFHCRRACAATHPKLRCAKTKLGKTPHDLRLDLGGALLRELYLSQSSTALGQSTGAQHCTGGVLLHPGGGSNAASPASAQWPLSRASWSRETQRGPCRSEAQRRGQCSAGQRRTCLQVGRQQRAAEHRQSAGRAFYADQGGQQQTQAG